jgi:hypothetical protein
LPETCSQLRIASGTSNVGSGASKNAGCPPTGVDVADVVVLTPSIATPCGLERL